MFLDPSLSPKNGKREGDCLLGRLRDQTTMIAMSFATALTRQSYFWFSSRLLICRTYRYNVDLLQLPTPTAPERLSSSIMYWILSTQSHLLLQFRQPHRLGIVHQFSSFFSSSSSIRDIVGFAASNTPPFPSLSLTRPISGQQLPPS